MQLPWLGRFPPAQVSWAASYHPLRLVLTSCRQHSRSDSLAHVSATSLPLESRNLDLYACIIHTYTYFQETNNLLSLAHWSNALALVFVLIPFFHKNNCTINFQVIIAYSEVSFNILKIIHSKDYNLTYSCSYRGTFGTLVMEERMINILLEVPSLSLNFP